jgi:hypothetical protein
MGAVARVRARRIAAPVVVVVAATAKPSAFGFVSVF